MATALRPIYTAANADAASAANGLESVHAQLRKIIKTRGHFPNDDAATKLIWLALRNITAKWARVLPYRRPAMNQLAILYEGCFFAFDDVKGHGAWTLPEPWTPERARRSLENRTERVFHSAHMHHRFTRTNNRTYGVNPLYTRNSG